MPPDLRRRLKSILQPNAEDFKPLHAAACLLDASLCAVLMKLLYKLVKCILCRSVLELVQ